MLDLEVRQAEFRGKPLDAAAFFELPVEVERLCGFRVGHGDMRAAVEYLASKHSTGSKAQLVAEQILRALRANSTGLSRTQIYREVLNRNTSASVMNEALAILLRKRLVTKFYRKDNSASGQLVEVWQDEPELLPEPQEPELVFEDSTEAVLTEDGDLVASISPGK